MTTKTKHNNIRPCHSTQALDINSDGYISKNEMVSASIRTGRRMSKNEVEAAFKEYDRNKVSLRSLRYK